MKIAIVVAAIILIVLVYILLRLDWKKEQTLIDAGYQVRRDSEFVSGFTDFEMSYYRKDDHSPWLNLREAYKAYLADQKKQSE